jgi:hydroxyacylglutathione hydrolase
MAVTSAGGSLADVLVRQFQLPGLGHLSTLIADQRWGVAAIVDPRRDVDAYVETAATERLQITHVLETHLHNDYVSGARELAAQTGAEHVIGAGAELAHEHRPIRDREALLVGDLRVTALDTPGHTPEHVAYAVADTARADEPWLLLTGGSLLVGSVGRTDLLGADNALPFARAQFHSLHDVVLPHEDFVGVYPTHGAGSLCSTNISSTPSSTIGFERRHNPYLEPTDAESFARLLLADQPAFPTYFAHMRGINQSGPPAAGPMPEPISLGVDDVRAAIDEGAVVVDLRSPQRYGAGHIPGSISIAAGDSFATWLGWTVEWGRPIVLVLRDPTGWDTAVRWARRIGYDDVRGYLEGGVAAWAEAGQPIETTPQMSVEELAAALQSGGEEAPFVIDVRQASEFDAGHIAESVHIGAGELPSRLDELPRDRPIALICASGFRSSIGASLLRRAGFANVSNVSRGLPHWTACGLPVARGPRSGVRLAPPPGSADTVLTHAH